MRRPTGNDGCITGHCGNLRVKRDPLTQLGATGVGLGLQERLEKTHPRRNLALGLEEVSRGLPSTWEGDRTLGRGKSRDKGEARGF